MTGQTSIFWWHDLSQYGLFALAMKRFCLNGCRQNAHTKCSGCHDYDPAVSLRVRVHVATDLAKRRRIAACRDALATAATQGRVLLVVVRLTVEPALRRDQATSNRHQQRATYWPSLCTKSSLANSWSHTEHVKWCLCQRTSPTTMCLPSIG